ncbi:MAG TPA: helix-turn-helix domain-containing protein [Candidatus Paceibacterota bacterium]|nr:helix-turn-helix domain-containing protein [Verrucomicrobiota bacterium]HRY50329.1 helix-turn-helix domain-containing protein [Candidatus Paceibacterota bacterium]
MDLSRKLKSVRESLNLSQSQAAAAWGISVRTLQEWEQGRHQPRGLALAQLEQILDKALQEGRGTQHKSTGQREKR